MQTANPIFKSRESSRLAVDRETLGLFLMVGLVVALGAAIRLFFILSEDFPLNDGGLFYHMSRELIEHDFSLPVYTGYNSSQIPYAYPPLPFYLVGLAHTLLGIGLFEIVRFMPLIFNILSIPAFFLLSRQIIEDDYALILATLAFAVLPPGYQWLIMGGGVTRAPAFFFSLLGLWLFLSALKRQNLRRAWGAGIFAGLTALSHLEIFFMMVIWMAIAALLAPGKRWAAGALVAAGLVSAAIAAPWALTVLARHGAGTFLSAFQTGGFKFLEGIFTFLLLSMTGEMFFTPVLVFGLIGLLIQLQRKAWLLPAWLAAVILFDTRSLARSAFIPLAMLAGIAIFPVGTQVLGLFSSTPGGKKRVLYSSLGVAFIFYLVLRSGFTAQLELFYKTTQMKAIATQEREAMQWIKDDLPVSSRFMVLTVPYIWEADKVSEWFPALAERQSLTTVQGSEWLPQGEFARREQLYDEIQWCALEGIACLEAETAQAGLDYTHIFISGKLEDKLTSAKSPMPIETELLASEDYRLIYQNTDVFIFERLPAGGAP
jgi:hypothetical protein